MWKYFTCGLILLLIFVTEGLLLRPSSAADEPAYKLVERLEDLPAGVARMRRDIMQAAISGDMERMRLVLESNELRPLIDGGFVHDPIKYWRARSPDKSGREVLALLSELLALPPVKRSHKGQDMFVWPYFAGVSLAQLKPWQQVALYRLAPAEQVAAMLKSGHYSYASISIGGDGTWHALERGGKRLAGEKP